MPVRKLRATLRFDEAGVGNDSICALVIVVMRSAFGSDSCCELLRNEVGCVTTQLLQHTGRIGGAMHGAGPSARRSNSGLCRILWETANRSANSGRRMFYCANTQYGRISSPFTRFRECWTAGRDRASALQATRCSRPRSRLGQWVVDRGGVSKRRFGLTQLAVFGRGCVYPTSATMTGRTPNRGVGGPRRSIRCDRRPAIVR